MPSSPLLDYFRTHSIPYKVSLSLQTLPETSYWSILCFPPSGTRPQSCLCSIPLVSCVPGLVLWKLSTVISDTTSLLSVFDPDRDIWTCTLQGSFSCFTTRITVGSTILHLNPHPPWPNLSLMYSNDLDGIVLGVWLTEFGVFNREKTSDLQPLVLQPFRCEGTFRDPILHKGRREDQRPSRDRTQSYWG